MSMSNSNLETRDISIQETNSLSFKQGNVLSHIVRQLTESVSPHFFINHGGYHDLFVCP